MKHNHFHIVAPMYSASGTLDQMLASLAAQTYTDWHLVLIDDMSPIEEQDECVHIIRRWDDVLRGHSKVTLLANDTKKWEVANVLRGISLSTDPDDIIVRIDPDDYLCDVDAFKVVNEAYNETGADCVWTAHRWFDATRFTLHNISCHLSNGENPYTHPWVSSHMKTFRRRLIEGVNDVNFRGQDGEYIRRAGDQAIYLPVLFRAMKRLYIPFCTYAYRCDMSPATFQTDDAKFQKAEAEFLRARGYVQ